VSRKIIRRNRHGANVNGRIFPRASLESHMGVKLRLHSPLSSALDGGEWLASRSGRFIPADIDQIAH